MTKLSRNTWPPSWPMKRDYNYIMAPCPLVFVVEPSSKDLCKYGSPWIGDHTAITSWSVYVRGGVRGWGRLPPHLISAGRLLKVHNVHHVPKVTFPPWLHPLKIWLIFFLLLFLRPTQEPEHLMNMNEANLFIRDQWHPPVSMDADSLNKQRTRGHNNVCLF